MPSSRPSVVVARAAGRAVVGAVAGLILTTLALLVASEFFQLVTFREPTTGDPLFRMLLGLGVVGMAGLAVVRGGVSFSEMGSSVLRAACGGAAIGLVGGAAIGLMLLGPKVGPGLGVFVVGPLGALLGGILGFENVRVARRRGPVATESDRPEPRNLPPDLRESPGRRDAGA